MSTATNTATAATTTVAFSAETTASADRAGAGTASQVKVVEMANKVRPLVEFDRVDLAYDDTGGNAIEDVTMNIREGEFVAIVGPSGCGKSTFMKLVSGLRPPSKGSVIVDGREVSGPLKIVGMAFQAPTLLPWRTTLDNVLLPLEIVEPYRSTMKKNVRACC